MTVENHRHNQGPDTIHCMVITVSDSRNEETDRSGSLIKQMLNDHSLHVSGYKIVRDETNLIQETIKQAVSRNRMDALLINGGTGIADRDVTYEAVKELLYKELPGFGELFRYLSYVKDIGSAAILSRAIAGTYDGSAVFSMPGSTKAVQLAMSEIILPELNHVVSELKKDHR